MTRERYQAYLRALEQLDQVESDQAGTDSPEQLRELAQDVFLCRDPKHLAQLLEQVAMATTNLAATGALSRDASTRLFHAVIDCGPEQPYFVADRAPTLVGS